MLMIWPHLLSKRLLLLICTCLPFLIYCQTIKEAMIEDLREESLLTDYRMISLAGRRDGDRLPVQVIFEATSEKLQMHLLFRIGVPTRLESGEYYWKQTDKTLEGRVRERSVTFLGGQSDNPNLGGVFELLSTGGVPIYKVTIPTSEVRPPSASTPSMAPSH